MKQKSITSLMERMLMVAQWEVLICCYGINSSMAKWLGFQKPVFTGSFAIWAFAVFENGHGFGPKFRQFFGNGLRFALTPCNDRLVYWASTWKPFDQEKEVLEEASAKLKQIVLEKLEGTYDEIKSVVERTPVDGLLLSPLRTRQSWELLWANISKGDVGVVGDALHCMTPRIGQGRCSAMEDGVILARCLAEALQKLGGERKENEYKEEEYKRTEMGLKKYAKERRWRSFNLITTSYIVGTIEENNGRIMSFFADELLSAFPHGLRTRIIGFDCGKLCIY